MKIITNFAKRIGFQPRVWYYQLRGFAIERGIHPLQHGIKIVAGSAEGKKNASPKAGIDVSDKVRLMPGL
ncbi:TPA: hypothetical protein ACF7ZB_000575 [Kluyvera georgiana]